MLTILTDPISQKVVNLRFFNKIAKIVYYSLKRNPTIINQYGGHSAVTRSLIEGLKKNRLPYSYNVRSENDLAENVLVLSGKETLKQAIDWKKKKRIRKLIAGPNIVIFSSDSESILADPEVDLIITPSQWVNELYIEDNPGLLNRCIDWPAGVDTEFWIPNSANRELRTVLIFDKRTKSDDPFRTNPYLEFFEEIGWSVERITRSAKDSYTSDEFLKKLQKCSLLVGFTVGSESQGIAWAEAWSCNVPTLVQSSSRNSIGGRSFSCSTAPYLTEKTGLFFQDFNDFKHQFSIWEKHKESFSPREWVIENMSDEVCAQKLYDRLMI